jgi:uncharacterized OB-fold protein
VNTVDAQGSGAPHTGLLAPQPPGFPVPRPSARSEPFWRGCREGRLVLPLCASCGARALRAFAVCPLCAGTNVSWEQSSGHGTLYSWTVVWRPPHPAFVVPYAPAVVALDEGWWFLSAVVGCAPEDLREGLALQVEFHPASENVVLPYFRSTA